MPADPRQPFLALTDVSFSTAPRYSRPLLGSAKDLVLVEVAVAAYLSRRSSPCFRRATLWTVLLQNPKPETSQRRGCVVACSSTILAVWASTKYAAQVPSLRWLPSTQDVFRYAPPHSEWLASRFAQISRMSFLWSCDLLNRVQTQPVLVWPGGAIGAGMSRSSQTL